VRTPLWLLLGAVVAWGGVSTWRRANRETVVLATTRCPFFGAPTIEVSPDVSPADAEPVRAHEAVHASQCRDLGPWRYRWRNLRAAGKLSLEAPAYCAAAHARVSAGLDSARVRQRLVDDAMEALRHVADSSRVVSALRDACGGLL
jgi:hypothetical protein